jgi:hypothetical protein
VHECVEFGSAELQDFLNSPSFFTNILIAIPAMAIPTRARVNKNSFIVSNFNNQLNNTAKIEPK